MLMSGLVGLTLGLFIGWWVWPVEWTEAPSSGPPASAPAQQGDAPAAESEDAGSSYTAFVDLISQGLLYVAALLLLVGGVVIANQLLRQSQGKPPPIQPFPLPFGRRRSNQATAPREARAGPPPLAERPVSQRRPSLDWLRKGRPTGAQSAPVEPVFTEQAGVARRPIEGSPDSPLTDSGATPVEPVRRPGPVSGAGVASSRRDDAGTTEDRTERQAGRPGTLAEPRAAGDREQTRPALAGDAEAAGRAFEEEEVELPSEKDAAGRGDEDAPIVSVALEEESSEGEQGQVGMGQTDPQSDEFGGSREDEEPEIRETAVGPSQAEAGRAAELGSRDTGWDESLERSSGGLTAAEDPVALPDRRMEARPTSDAGGETLESRRDLSEPEQAVHSSRQQVGQFEASYAFGIQSYDESFTINAADGELLGACGMGINESVDRDAATTDQVRLLDIWLYDRSAVRSVSQPLVSPGFSSSGLEDHAGSGGSESAPPLEVAPGLTCTLRSDGIALECRIESVTFMEGEQAPLPFRSVRASFAVYVSS